MSQPALTYSHGRHLVESKKFVQKVRDAISNNNVEQLQLVAQFTSAPGLCAYFQPSQLYDPDDVGIIRAHIIGTPTAYQTFKFLVKSAEMNYQITLSHDTAAFMRVYECEARGDVPETNTLTTPLAYLNQGWTDLGYAANATDYRSTVFSSPLFCTWYKVKSTKVIEFQPGETKRFNLIDKSPTLVNCERWQPAGSNSTLVSKQRKSKFLVFQVWGQNVDDSATGAIVTLDHTKFNVVMTKRYEFRWSQDYDTNIFTDGSALSTATGAYSFINPDTDQVIVNTTPVAGDA